MKDRLHHLRDLRMMLRVKAGYECGLVFEKFNDIAEGDQVEAYIMVEVPR